MTAQDRSAIADMIKSWTRAVATKDTRAVEGFFSKEVVEFDLAPPLKTVGFDRKMLEAWFKTWDGPLGYEIMDQSINLSDTLAVMHGLSHLTGRKIEGEQVDLWSRTTVCFRKEAGSWTVFHVHNSVPLLMDGSGKAATDLKPDITSLN
jgi:ketosteroid isomerase-like protein